MGGGVISEKNYATSTKESISDATEVRKSGKVDFSESLKRLRTKFISPSCFLFASSPVPRRKRGKSSVFKQEMMDLRPLFPPAEPLFLFLKVPKGMLKSSQMTRISEVLIL